MAAREPSVVLLTDAEIVLIAEQAVDGDEPLDEILAQRIFGGAPPERWGDWPDDAVRMWKDAVAIWRILRDEHRPEIEEGEDSKVPLRTSWEAIDEVRARIEMPPRHWFRIPNVTWGDIASVLGLGATSTAWHFGLLGWKLDGVYSTRKVVAAPCVRCGRIHPAEEIHQRLGDCCDG